MHNLAHAQVAIVTGAAGVLGKAITKYVRIIEDGT